METVLKTVASQLLCVLELNQIVGEKERFIKAEDYINASKLRSKELKLRAKLLTSDSLFELRKKLNKLK